MAAGVIFNHFPRIAAALKPACQRAVDRTALAIQTNAKSNAPVDTGFMRDSIAITSGNMQATVFVGAYYAIYVEMGHHTRGGGSWVPAQPFFFPAVAQGGSFFDTALMAVWTAVGGA